MNEDTRNSITREETAAGGITVRIPKNSLEEYRITREPYRGKDLLDVRVYYEKEGQWLPGRKGISAKPEVWAEILPIIQEMLAE